MRRSLCQGRAQLRLALEAPGPKLLPSANPSGLIEALAELLLKAAGAAGPLTMGGADEQQDHR